MKRSHSKKSEPTPISQNQRDREERKAWDSGYSDGYASGSFFYHPLEVDPKSHPTYKKAYVQGFNDFKGSHQIVKTSDKKFDKENHPSELL